MKNNTLARIAALALVAGTTFGAYAQTAPLTRAQVVQELVEARANGTLPRPGAWYDEPAPVHWNSDATPTSRSAVIKELERARAAGELNNPGQGYSQPITTSDAPGLTRAEVVAELARARAAGELRNVGAGYDEPVQVTFGRQPAAAQATARTEPAADASRVQ